MWLHSRPWPNSLLKRSGCTPGRGPTTAAATAFEQVCGHAPGRGPPAVEHLCVCVCVCVCVWLHRSWLSTPRFLGMRAAAHFSRITRLSIDGRADVLLQRFPISKKRITFFRLPSRGKRSLVCFPKFSLVEGCGSYAQWKLTIGRSTRTTHCYHVIRHRSNMT